MLHGQMMKMPLLISSIISHAARNSARVEVVSRGGDGNVHRYRYGECDKRSRQLASALERSGIEKSDRVATLAFNSFRHLEIYYGVAGMGAVCHTINPRLFLHQISYIINHAGDKVVFFEPAFQNLVRQLTGACPSVKLWIALGGTGCVAVDPGESLTTYESFIDGGDARYEWPTFEEEAAAGLCYTSGTTGAPKGVLYSHRSTVLHAFSSALPDALAVSASDVIMPVVPMFHVNAWGLPYSAPLVGAKLVLPGPLLDGQSLYELIESEGVTSTAGVPSVWQGLIEYTIRNRLKFSKLRTIVVGGSACPKYHMDVFEAMGIDVVHGWGMTELSPTGSTSRLLGQHESLPSAERGKILSKQGRALAGVEFKVVGANGQELPWNGESAGELFVRSPWVVERYFGAEESAVADGWFATGDIATIDADGYMQITDRSKDVIKSGGEWISSIELENIAVAHPAVLAAACIACHHPKWDERPLLIIRKRTGMEVTREELIAWYEGKVAKWWMPDDVVFADDIPMAATGKINKLKLREMFREHRLPTIG